MNFLRTLLGACSGLQFYTLALHWSAGDAIKHLLKLNALAAIVLMAALVPRATQWIDDANVWVTQKLNPPPFSIVKGKVKSDVPQPCVLDLPNFHFVLDTTGATRLAATGAVNGIIITNDHFYMWGTNMPPMTLFANQLPDGKVDASTFHEWMNVMLWMMVLPGVAMLFALFFILTLMHSVFFGGIAAVVERSLPVHFSFGQLFRISAMAVTPSLVVSVGLAVLGLGQGWLLLIFMVAYGFYFSGATAAARPLLTGQGNQQ